MKTLMALVLSFGMVLLGTAPVMAAGQPMAPKAAVNLNAPIKTPKPDPSLTQPAIPEPPGFRTMSDEELEGVDGEGFFGVLGGLVLAGDGLHNMMDNDSSAGERIWGAVKFVAGAFIAAASANPVTP